MSDTMFYCIFLRWEQNEELEEGNKIDGENRDPKAQVKALSSSFLQENPKYKNIELYYDLTGREARGFKEMNVQAFNHCY